MRVKKIDDVVSNCLIGVRIQRAPVSKSVPVARHDESLVISTQHQALGFKFTAHRDDLVIGSRTVIVAVDEEKRLERPAWAASLTNQHYWVQGQVRQCVKICWK